jgi:hypothetical protein
MLPPILKLYFIQTVAFFNKADETAWAWSRHARESAIVPPCALGVKASREHRAEIGGWTSDLRTGVGGRRGEEEDGVNELDSNVLDGIYLAGERFDPVVKRLMVS